MNLVDIVHRDTAESCGQSNPLAVLPCLILLNVYFWYSNTCNLFSWEIMQILTVMDDSEWSIKRPFTPMKVAF